MQVFMISKKKYHNYHSCKSDFAYCKPFQQEETPDKSEDGEMYLWGQVRKQNFPTFHICILFWYFCEISFGIVTTAFQSVPTAKKCLNFFCVGVPMLTKKEYND